MSQEKYPRLRPVDSQIVNHNGQPAIMLRDPLQLSDQVVVVPRPLAPLLALCDGTRDLSALRAGLAVRTGIVLSPEDMVHIINQLDQAFLLDNERFAEAKAGLLHSFRSTPFRPPALAGSSYPADPDHLRRYLQSFVEDLEIDGQVVHDGRGLVSPHIDYQRGGPVYAHVWTAGAELARDADLAIIFGTDHNGSFGTLTLTRQNYATPFGILPTATDVVDAVVEAIGEDAAFEEELHHRREHSVELAAVWLHHVREGRPIEMVPILCGSFAHFVVGLGSPAEDPTFAAAIEALQRATAGRQVIVIAAGDLAHVGPAFGDPHPLDWADRARIQASDNQLIDTMCRGDAEGFYELIRAEGDRRRICGLPPIYLALRFLNGTQGMRAGYDRCPADPQNGSLVSVCGVVWE
ncbi:MAG: AmmeMemoRadiSam system protein B [Caldilineae bacterium]|nr:MAG: AmmeMemoRadiSam system protein B [Caldilineae bacterium]